MLIQNSTIFSQSTNVSTECVVKISLATRPSHRLRVIMILNAPHRPLAYVTRTARLMASGESGGSENIEQLM